MVIFFRNNSRFFLQISKKSRTFAVANIAGMLYRKYENHLTDFLRTKADKILLLNGARQIGKSYIIRCVGKKLFRNFIEIDLKSDFDGAQTFANIRTTDELYIQLGAIAGKKLGTFEDTLVFLDEIQSYPHLLTMLKFLNQEKRYRFIASGSQLGVALSETLSVPIGSVAIEQMYPLDFEEFLIAVGCAKQTIEAARECFFARKPLAEGLHKYFMRQFRLYLLVGGMPEAVNMYLSEQNIVKIRAIHRDIHNLYRIDASQYDTRRKLVIRKIYDMLPSTMENKKKRVVVKNIEQKAGHAQFSDYADEFEYLTNSGIAMQVQAVSNPRFPLTESVRKNLLKLYINDVGLLTHLLYSKNINAILNDERSINLGAVYETVVAQELHAHGFVLHYYDNKQKGEVDFLINDYGKLQVLPIEVKSGKDYSTHSALNAFVQTPDYNISESIVLCNDANVFNKNGITYMPVYYVMFLNNDIPSDEAILPFG